MAKAVWGAQEQLSGPRRRRRRPGQICQVTQFPNPALCLQAYPLSLLVNCQDDHFGRP